MYGNGLPTFTPMAGLRLVLAAQIAIIQIERFPKLLKAAHFCVHLTIACATAHPRDFLMMSYLL